MKHHSAIQRVAIVSALVMAFAGSVFAAGPTPADDKYPNKQIFQCMALNMMGAFAGRPIGLEITINQYNTPADKQTLITALQEGGQEGLMKTLQKMDAGFVTVTGSTGWKVNAAWTNPTSDGGKRVVCFFQRPTTFAENYSDSRSLEYQFAIIELLLGPDNKGEKSGNGTIIPAAQIGFTTSGQIGIESFGAQPGRIMGLSERK
ncbi:MAG TPA: hypothetical protein PLF26_17355 [Blastocatellia bacterium]|nr:hypothetical protein [Blastocatellia bacterium]